jgi:DNA/RNA-binding domain of Phe-tRNA-synthetase-like protein
MNLTMNFKLKTQFPDLNALLLTIKGVTVKKQTNELESFKLEVINRIIKKYNLHSVKNHPIFRAYRDFFWKIGIDPTKIRPAAEALTRRVLAGKKLPCINTLVDTYNLASIDTGIALATFDLDKLKGHLFMRFAEKNEKILGIGMKKPFILKGEEIVVSDQEKLIAVYPYRDAENTKVTTKTENVKIVVCGVPRINNETLRRASNLAEEYILRFCNGKRISVKEQSGN